MLCPDHTPKGKGPAAFATFLGTHYILYNTRRMQSIVGERNERKRQGRLRLRVARGRMRTDRGRLMTYKHTYIHTCIQTKLPLSSLVRARCARPIICITDYACVSYNLHNYYTTLDTTNRRVKCKDACDNYQGILYGCYQESSWPHPYLVLIM